MNKSSGIDVIGPGSVNLNAKYNIVRGLHAGIAASINANIKLQASEHNIIKGDNKPGVEADGDSTISIIGKQNIIVGTSFQGINAVDGTIYLRGEQNNKIISKDIALCL